MAVKLILSRMTLLDGVIIAALLAGIGFSFFLLGQRQEGSRVVVEREGKILFSASLDQDRQVSFDGPVGKTILVVGGGEAFIRSSDCRDKVCVRMAEIGKVGEWVACVPNRLLVRIEGDKAGREGNYDILSR
ncbi:MAG: NusG domain II-containing protein [Desulfuromonadaceae bacterium]|nr:NusG domain II-containing protein [Desulfuromonadaceae bacterium]